MRILVTGGAGYIGSQMVRELVEKKIATVVADSLENGHRAAVPSEAMLLVGNIGDAAFREQVFARGPFDAVIHFAGYISPRESMFDPTKYFRNNVMYTNELLDTMVQHDCKYIVFSSSAAVYGNPVTVPMPEDQPLKPINAYGASKLMVEEILPWYQTAHGLRAISLRYFNASGATPDGKYGEDHPDEIHIIPLALRAALGGRPFQIFGDDYSTRDGTCVRDYIHIFDLCDAHFRAVDALLDGHTTASYNVGIGAGYTNREIVDAALRITGIPFEVKIGPRRPGDPAELVADSSKLRREFGWQPRFPDLDSIIGTAWQWHKTHPNGYGDR